MNIPSVYFYTHVDFVYVCELHVYVCAYVYRNQKSPSNVIPQILSMLFFETGSLTGAWDSLSSLVWVTSNM